MLSVQNLDNDGEPEFTIFSGGLFDAIDTRMAVATVLHYIGVSAKNIVGAQEMKRLGIDADSLRTAPRYGTDFLCLVIRIVNCIDYEVMREGTNVFLGFEECAGGCSSPRDGFLKFLLKLLRGSASDFVFPQYVLGLALYSLREHAQFHVWHGKPYCLALQDSAFVDQCHARERLLSYRERRWCLLLDAEPISQAQAQKKFAAVVTEISGCNKEAPSATAVDDEWIEFIGLQAAMMGFDMLCRIGFDSADTSSIYEAYVEATTSTLVGQEVPRIIQAYLLVGNDIPSNPLSVSRRIGMAWGLSCFYDVFFLSRERCEIEPSMVRSVFFQRYLNVMKAAFLAAAVAESPLATRPTRASILNNSSRHSKMETLCREAERRQATLIEEEKTEHRRLLHQQSKRREKKRRQKLNRRRDATEKSSVCGQAASVTGVAVDNKDPPVTSVLQESLCRPGPSVPKQPTPPGAACCRPLLVPGDQSSATHRCEESSGESTFDALLDAELCSSLSELFGPSCPIPLADTTIVF